MAATFRTLAKRNRRNSFLLLCFFGAFWLIAVGALGVGIAAGASSNGRIDEGLLYLDVLLSLALAVATAFLGYFRGASLVLFMNGARKVSAAEDPQLVHVVEEMALAAGLPAPDVYIIESAALNAFATGRSPRHAAVAVTRGLRQMLSREELQGVIAHELAHVQNYDTRLLMLSTVFVGTLASLADIYWRSVRLGPGGQRDAHEGRSAGRSLTALWLVLGLVVALIGPLLARGLQLALGREREYLADASAAALTRNPEALAAALAKIAADGQPLRSAASGSAALYIQNPVQRYRAVASSIFSSHPPIEERIRRLRRLTQADAIPIRGL